MNLLIYSKHRSAEFCPNPAFYIYYNFTRYSATCRCVASWELSSSVFWVKRSHTAKNRFNSSFDIKRSPQARLEYLINSLSLQISIIKELYPNNLSWVPYTRYSQI